MSDTEKWVDRIVDKLVRHDEAFDDIKKSMNAIDVSLARNTASLEIHVKRCDLLEKKLEHLEHKVDNKFDKLVPKAISVISLISGIYALAKAFKF